MRAMFLIAALPLAAQAQTVPPDEWTAAVNGNTAVYFEEGRVVRREYWLGSVFGFSLRMQDHTGDPLDPPPFQIEIVPGDAACAMEWIG